MNGKDLSLKTVKTALNNSAVKLRHYSLPLFIAMVAILYGFLLFRVHSLSSTEPAMEDVNKQVKGGRVLRIDPAVVKQLESLEDNSVSVQALFDQARSNPFQ